MTAKGHDKAPETARPRATHPYNSRWEETICLQLIPTFPSIRLLPSFQLHQYEAPEEQLYTGVKMKPAYPFPTSTWHNDTYPEISPSRPELNLRGKTGSEVGREAALAFARAGAKCLHLIGGTFDPTGETRDLIASISVECSVHQWGIMDEQDMDLIAGSVGTWDILILNATFLGSRATVAETSIDEWWQALRFVSEYQIGPSQRAFVEFHINVKGAMATIKAFLPKARSSDAAILDLNTGLLGIGPELLPGLSGYISSKFARVSLLEFVAAENPGIFVASVHPGVADAEKVQVSGDQADEQPMTTAHFLVWMASQEARFLGGKTVCANWDVEELKARADEIWNGLVMTAGILGGPNHLIDN
ncbi:MAG: hypothetical protein Q9221_007182 [Calogaya cf. arnoldii]